MPNTKSAKKRLRQNVDRRMQNKSVRSNMRSQIRKVREAVRDGELETADTLFRAAAQKLDRASARSLIHPNKAARTKSRLQKLIRLAKAS